jgi:hypothetical protein
MAKSRPLSQSAHTTQQSGDDRRVPARRTWRCFHCDEILIDPDAAALHFGRSDLARPACTVSLARLRELEALLSRYQAEDSNSDRRYHAMMADHAVALRRAEETGYARGLRDAGKT